MKTHASRRLIILPVLLYMGLHSFLIQAQERSPAVEADFETLRKVLVMSIDDSVRKSLEFGRSVHPVFNKGLGPGARREHRALIELMEREGVEVMQIRDLLQDAIVSARRKGELDKWLEESYPSQAEQLLAHKDSIDADTILQNSDSSFYRTNEKGELDPLFLPISSMYWSRDFAISTPKGIIIGNGKNFGRTMENSIARLIFRHAEALKDFPIVFDAAKEGVLLDGGDVMVSDPRTLLVGVGQRSDLEAAPLLAKKLDMEVIAVAMPPRDKPNGMSRQLLHLDSIFNFVDRNKVVTVPFFLEKAYVETNPMMKIISGFANQTDAILEHTESRSDSKQLRLTVELMAGVGWITRYEAGTGKATKLDMKLVDYARSQGWEVVFVGGDRGNLSMEKYAIERAMYELRWQGANVAQLAPGKIIAYEHNHYTNEALRTAGIEVLTFPGDILSIRNGGPHCLIMPLVRQK